MNKNLKIAKELQSESRVFLWIYAFDFLFLVFYAIAAQMLASSVYPSLKIPYYIFSAVCAVYLTLPSSSNKKRRNYQAIVIYLMRSHHHYYPRF